IHDGNNFSRNIGAVELTHYEPTEVMVVVVVEECFTRMELPIVLVFEKSGDNAEKHRARPFKRVEKNIFGLSPTLCLQELLNLACPRTGWNGIRSLVLRKK